MAIANDNRPGKAVGFAVICLGATALAGALSLTGGELWFRPYCGPKPALAAVVGLSDFGAIASLADATLGYPRDINVPPPDALLFSPAMAVVAEIVFRLAPPSLLVLAFGRFALRRAQPRPHRLAHLDAALLEPLYRTALAQSAAPDQRLCAALLALTAANNFAFNLTGLFLFARFGFLAMLLLRLNYHLFWHVLWGSARLDLLDA